MNKYTSTFAYSSIGDDELKDFKEIDDKNLNEDQKKVDDFVRGKGQLSEASLEKAEEKDGKDDDKLFRYTYKVDSEKRKGEWVIVVHEDKEG